MAYLGASGEFAVWFVTTIMAVLVGLRIVSRVKLAPNTASWEDLVIVLAGVLSIVSSALYTANDHRAATVKPSTAPSLARLTLTNNAIAIMNIAIPKISMALLLVRTLFSKPWVASIIVSLSLLLLVMSIIGVIIEFVQCSPVEALSAFLDFFYALYPSLVLKQLQMSRARKVSVGILMGFGIVAGAVSIFKTSQLPRLLQITNGETLLEATFFFAVWTSVENNVIIIAASVPTISPFGRLVKAQLSKIFPHMLSSVGRPRKGRASNKSYVKFPSDSKGPEWQQHEDYELAGSSASRDSRAAMTGDFNRDLAAQEARIAGHGIQRQD